MVVGDGKTNTHDALTGTLNLGSATNLNITADDGINGANPTFSAEVNANRVNYLGIDAANGSRVILGGQTDLGALSNVDVSGAGNVQLGSAGSLIGSASRSVYVNTENMNGGTFTGYFTGNTATDNNTASLAVQGSNLANNVIYVDGTYGDIDVNTGMGSDRLVIQGRQLESEQPERQPWRRRQHGYCARQCGWLRLQRHHRRNLHPVYRL